MLEPLIIFIVALIDLAYLVILISINMPQGKPAMKKLPKVSVIIAAKQERIVERTLRMLKKVKRPKIEIIVATSDKRTARIARRYAKVVMDKGVGKGAALNAAVRKATSKILYFLDEDSKIGKNTISEICSALNGSEVVAGSSAPQNNSGFVAHMARLYFATLIKVQFGLYRLIGTTFVPGRNFAIYKRTLKKAGYFRNALTEDMELTFRLFVRHKKAKFVDAPTQEQVPTKFSWYLKQQQRWNNGTARVLLEWEKRLHHHDIVLFFFIVLAGLIAPMSLIFLVLAVIFKSWLFLTVTILGFLICLSGVLTLDRDDIMLFPAVFFAFLFVQTYAVIYSAVNKPKGWYVTPKR